MRRDPPLVSCIMPTRNRRHLVGQAIEYFLRQDYPNKELIVVDDGVDCIADVVPASAGVRYVRLERRSSLGAKRNLACHASRGELIAHWDDDDWMAPDRLSQQVAALLGSNALATGARDLLYYRPHVGDAWLYRAPADERPWPLGGTLLYRRAVWEANTFPDMGVGEDAHFVARLPGERVLAVAAPSFYVGLLHADNTAPKNLDDAAWQPRSLDEVARLFGPDRVFYAGLRNGDALRGSRAARPPTSAITVAADFDIASGYGSLAEYLCRGLVRAGARVHATPLSVALEGLSEEFRDLLAASPTPSDPAAPTLYFSWPRAVLDPFMALPELFINTMWESDRLPGQWPTLLNQARVVIVPTRFVARACRDSGVEAPIEVVPEGIDPDVYTYVDRSPDRPFTTLMVGPFDDRKHVTEGVAAWKLACARDADARLLVKTRFAPPDLAGGDPRIRVVDARERTRGIARWYAEADVLLALGNEGFGLPLIEAMATGLPVIALDSEGQADTCRDAGACVLTIAPARFEAYDSTAFGRCGKRGVPSVEDVADRLRWVASHRQEAREMGRAASAWAVRERNIWDKAPAVLDVMERHVSTRRRLRRSYRLWVGSRGAQCGVAAYTAHLAAGMPTATGVRVEAGAEDLGGARVLHVQHHDGLYDEDALARTCAVARQNGVPVVLTEHMVRSDTAPAESEADALVSLSHAGVEALRARWPTRRVEHMPHGCPTWFPRRKRRRGRVIGAFGCMGRHTGFSRLLDLVRDGGDLELLVYASARSADEVASWSADAAGLAVRRETRCLPAAEIARQLAAEADVLAFWDDEMDFPTLSGAVRVGLASGVPVLTSPTSWFADLREVTYQPPELESGVRRLLDDTDLREHLVAAAQEYCHAHSWTRIAERHLSLWRSLENR